MISWNYASSKRHVHVARVIEKIAWMLILKMMLKLHALDNEFKNGVLTPFKMMLKMQK